MTMTTNTDVVHQDINTLDADVSTQMAVTIDKDSIFSSTNLELYYEFHNIGELVEIEHAPNKYWLARIKFKFKGLVLINWLCDYGEKWIDSDENSSKRILFPPGYYLQPQFKHSHTLTRPSTFKDFVPKQYDPYYNITDIETLISFEEPTIDQQQTSELDANEQLRLAQVEEDKLEQCKKYQLKGMDEFNRKLNTRIYFNHKCFTGPSLSKSKICAMPQYVGPGPFRLVLEEVVTKVISVAYVPPRILNELSSNSFKQLLTSRGIVNTVAKTFKAKYQKKVCRELLQVIINPEDTEAYCECICEHIKCCYNLFGPKLYDGDDCPSHCRALTKSNKFMKRATYYREKARMGDPLSWSVDDVSKFLERSNLSKFAPHLKEQVSLNHCYDVNKL